MVLLRTGKPYTNDEVPVEQLRAQLNHAQAERDEALARMRGLQANLEAERAVRTGIEHSVSWRVTEPARRFMTMLRQLRK